jgi:hypothetical protein
MENRYLTNSKSSKAQLEGIFLFRNAINNKNAVVGSDVDSDSSKSDERSSMCMERNSSVRSAEERFPMTHRTISGEEFDDQVRLPTWLSELFIICA